MKIILLIAAGLSLTACNMDEDVRVDQTTKATTALQRATIECRDGVQFYVGWVGDYRGGPFVTPRPKQGGGFYKCGMRPYDPVKPVRDQPMQEVPIE